MTLSRSSILAQFQRVGHDLFSRGLVSSHGGNISLRLADRLFITAHGSMLGHVTQADLVEVDLKGETSPGKNPSMELVVHRAIYERTSAQAIIHAHPVHAITLSFVETEIIPVDIEGSYLLKRVPVVGKGLAPASTPLAGAVAQGLLHSSIVVAYGHGSFGAGHTPEEALHWTTALEESCQILCWLKAFGSPRDIVGK